MKFKTTWLSLTGALLISTTLSSMAQDAPPPSLPSFTNADITTEAPVAPSHVMAIIKGQEITAGQLDAMANDIDPALARLPDQQRRLTVLKIYIDMKVLAEAAIKEQLDKTKEFDTRMVMMRDSLLQQMYFKQNILDKITEADIEARYKEEIAALPKEQEIHARHILVKTKEEAEKLIQRLDKGEKFEDLAKEASTDGSAAMGGDLGYFTKGQMVKPFEDAAFALKAGQYTKQPVESPFGWHIIKVEDLREKEPPALADVKDTLINMIARDRYSALIAQLRENAKVTYPDKNIAAAMQEPVMDAKTLPGELPQEDEEE